MYSFLLKNLTLLLFFLDEIDLYACSGELKCKVFVCEVLKVLSEKDGSSLFLFWFF